MSARVMPAQGGNGVDVKDWEALAGVIETAYPGCPIGFVQAEDSDETAMVEVYYGGLRLVIQDNGYIDVIEANGVRPGPIRPEMYPVVKAAIAEIERQNA